MHSVPAPLRRLGAALAVSAAVAAMVLVAPAAAQAFSGDAITVSGASAQITGSGGAREVLVTYDVAFADPVNGSGTVDITVETNEDCATPDSGTSGHIFTGNQTAQFTSSIPATGFVRVLITPNDGSAGPGPVTEVYANSPEATTVPSTATFYPDPAGTSGVVTVTTGSELPSYAFELWENGAILVPQTNIGACYTVDIPFSGAGAAHVLQLRSPDLNGAVLATYTVPGGSTAVVDVADPAAASSEDELAYTGSADVWPGLLVGLLLLAGGVAVLAVVRSRSAR